MVALASGLIGLGNLSGFGFDINITFVLRSKKLGTTAEIEFAIAPKRWATQKRRGSYGRPNSSPFG
jgi:hypothetical protein